MLKKSQSLLFIIVAAVLLWGCDVNIKTSDDSKKDPKKESTKQAPETDDEQGDDPATVPQENTPESDPAPQGESLNTPYEGKIATEIFRDEVMPRFMSEDRLAKQDPSWNCDEETYSPLEIESSDYTYNCSIEYLGRGTNQEFIMIFQSDGNYVAKAVSGTKRD